jgi:hypothetical protein
VAGLASADTLAVNFDDTGVLVGTGPGVNLGWEFSIASPITVTELGFWDHAADGLAEAKTIAIWSSSSDGALGSALVTGVVAEGAGSPFAPGSQFRMADVTDTLLAAGSYVVAGRQTASFADDYVDKGAGNEVFGPGITFVERRFSGSASFEMPTLTDADTGGIYGPSFSFLVPEPSSAALLFGAGLAGLAWRRRASAR